MSRGFTPAPPTPQERLQALIITATWINNRFFRFPRMRYPSNDN